MADRSHKIPLFSVKEEELLLLISLPTRGLSTLRQELTKLGEVSLSEADAAPNAPTTLLQVTFVRQPPIFPPAASTRWQGTMIASGLRASA